MKNYLRKVLFLLILLGVQFSIFAQNDLPIDATTRNEAINEILQTIKENYFSEEMGNKIEVGIRQRLARKEYDSITSAKILADTLTQHLYEICKDRHVYVRIADGTAPNSPPLEMSKEGNFGFIKIEILSGNIGYLQIDAFPPPNLARETLAAAMKFLQNTDALIIDLRKHRGGAIPMVALMVSYFVSEKPIQLITVDAPRTQRKSESWTLDKVDAPRYLNKPVYLLTSQNTFSGGEEFAYDMQALKRATLIGETTKGGANPVQLFPIQNLFRLGVSFAQVKNTITGTNWEGVGVKPDISTTAEKALEVAQAEANKKLAALKNKVTETAQVKMDTAQVKLENPTQIEFPNTPAAKTLEAFLSAFNGGEKDKLIEFHIKRLPKTEAGKRAAEENSNQDFQFYQTSGGLIPKKIVNLSNTKIQLFAQLKNNNNWILFTIEVDSQEPHPIVNLGVEQANPIP